MKLSKSSILLKIIMPKLLTILGLATIISTSHMLWPIRYDPHMIRPILHHMGQPNRGQFKNPVISGALYTLRVHISILKLNVKMAPEMSGFFN